MAKASQAEIAGRCAILEPLLIDGLALHEIRSYVAAKTPWGAQLSLSQLKRYIVRAKQTMRAQAPIDRSYELVAAKRRGERALARSAATGDLRTYLAANAQLIALLGLAAPTRIECSDVDVAAARAQLEAEIAKEMADRETDS